MTLTDIRRGLHARAVRHGHTSRDARLAYTLGQLIFVVPVDQKHAVRQKRRAERLTSELGGATQQEQAR